MSRKVYWLAMLIFLTGCARHVTIRPPVSTSLGYVVFQELGEIYRAPLHVGLLIDKQLQDLTTHHSGGLGTVEVPIGQILAAKLIKLVSYKFERITLVTNRSNAPPLLLHIGLQGENPSVGVDIDMSASLTGVTTFDVIAKIDLRLRATLTDNEQTVWVGAARLVEEMKSGGVAYGAMDGATQASDITNRVTDLLVSRLAQQMRRSESLRRFLENKRK